MLIDTPESGSINVVRTGPRNAPTLLFLHPVGLDSGWFDNQISALGQAYDIVAMDMPGHGLSSPLSVAPTFPSLADTVASVLDTLGIKTAHIVGLSFGGMIAQYLTLRRPALVRSLVLIGTAHSAVPVKDALRQRAAVAASMGMAHLAKPTIDRWFGPGFSDRRPDVLDRATMTLSRQDAATHAAIWNMVADLDLSESDINVTCPVLVVGGDADVNTPLPVVQALSEAWAGAPIKMIEGVGHFPPVEAAERFNAILGRFVDEVEARSAIVAA